MKIFTKYIIALCLGAFMAITPVAAAAADNPDKELAAAAPAVKAQPGGILIENPAEEAHVMVYALTGQVVKQMYIGQGQTSVELPSGYYIVRIGQTTVKVAVK